MLYNPKDDLHGNVPEPSDVCLLIIDMINPFTFDGAEEMLPTASAAAERIATLTGRRSHDPDVERRYPFLRYAQMEREDLAD